MSDDIEEVINYRNTLLRLRETHELIESAARRKREEDEKLKELTVNSLQEELDRRSRQLEALQTEFLKRPVMMDSNMNGLKTITKEFDFIWARGDKLYDDVHKLTHREHTPSARELHDTTFQAKIHLLHFFLNCRSLFIEEFGPIMADIVNKSEQNKMTKPEKPKRKSPSITDKLKKLKKG